MNDRVQGCLLGVAAGDKNGGPIQMALMICESAVDKNTLSPSNIFARYIKWYFEKQPGYDDTGIVARDVFKQAQRHFTLRDFDIHNIESKINEEGIYKISDQVHLNLNGYTAGINGAHRGCILAMFSGFTTPKMLSNAVLETKMTHVHPAAFQTTQLSSLLCRILINNGTSVRWWEQLHEDIKKFDIKLEPELQEATCDILGSEQEFLNMLENYKNKESDCEIRQDGYSPNTIRAALFFLRKHTGVPEISDHSQHSRIVKQCFEESFSFAGPNNYCPVLVGAFLGAMFGGSAVRPYITNCVCLTRVEHVAKKISEKW